MTGLVIFLLLLFSGIVIWAGIRMVKGDREPTHPAHPRPHIIAPSPMDPWGTGMMRRRERDPRSRE